MIGIASAAAREPRGLQCTLSRSRSTKSPSENSVTISASSISWMTASSSALTSITPVPASRRPATTPSTEIDSTVPRKSPESAAAAASSPPPKSNTSANPSSIAGIIESWSAPGSGLRRSRGLLRSFAPAAAGAPQEDREERRPCAGERANVVGTAKTDKIRLAGLQRRVVVSLEGADVILGSGERDLVCAGPGPDQVGAGGLLGPAGSRAAPERRHRGVVAGGGADGTPRGQGRGRVSGGGGPDQVLPGGAKDRGWGDKGADGLVGARATIGSSAGPDDDFVTGQIGDDRLFGAARATTGSSARTASTGSPPARGRPHPGRPGPDTWTRAPATDIVGGGPGGDTGEGGDGGDLLIGVSGR